VALVGMALTASLGLAAVARAEKEAAGRWIDRAPALPALDGATLAKRCPTTRRATAAPRHHPARPLAGRAHGLSRQPPDGGQPGFYVLTPLQLEGSDGVVLVQRGWVPRNFQDRSLLPPVQTPPAWCRCRAASRRRPAAL
jgi:surfeit locus 1 family protein